MRVHAISVNKNQLDHSQELLPQFKKIIEETLRDNGYENPIVFTEKINPLPTEYGYLVGCTIDFPPGAWISTKSVTPPVGFVIEVKFEGGATKTDIIYKRRSTDDKLGYYDIKGAEYFSITHFRILYKSIVNSI